MSEEGLKDFLRKQARSLDSLLELTPAKNMFGEDVSDQWKRKKQTPEQKKAARMAKLDPANWKSAKDVYDERSAAAVKKRKREQEGKQENPDQPMQEQSAKKQRTENKDHATPKAVPTEKLTEHLDADLLGNKNLKKKAKKRAARKERNEQMREQKDNRKETKQTADSDKKPQALDKTNPTKKNAGLEEKVRTNASRPQGEQSTGRSRQTAPQSGSPARKSVDKIQADDKDADKDEDEVSSDVVEDENKSGESDSDQIEDGADSADEDEEMEDVASTATSSAGVPEILSPPQDSAASSVSSIVPPPKAGPQAATQRPETESTDNPDTVSASTVQTEMERQAARRRLQEQISQFRSQRKADDRPVRSRAELLAQRRQKEQERKAAKKEQRRKEKEDEAKRQDEEIAKRFSPGGSGSLLTSPRSPMIDEGGGNAFTFGRIAFDDGTQFDAATGSAAANKKHKGPADPATALKAAQAKQARIAGLDDEKKQTIDEKDMWLNAKKRAHGERVKDDTSLLKKALKRQEKQKQRSGKEWDDRVEGVRSAQESKQRKRTENLQKRKDEKGTKSSSSSSKKKVKRPGFEGSFRGRTGKGKKT